MLFELLTQRSCRWSIRNIAALVEKGAEYTLVDVTGPDGHGRADWYLPLNPFGRTPALRHGDVVIVESLLMNEYIDEVAPGRALLPSTSAGRAWARTWAGHNDQTLMPQLSRLAKAQADDARANALSDIRIELARTEARAFEHAAEDGPFWNGTRPGLVDIGWWTFFNALGSTLARLGGHDEVARHTRLATWRDALLSHPTFHDATRRLDSLRPTQVLSSGRQPGTQAT